MNINFTFYYLRSCHVMKTYLKQEIKTQRTRIEPVGEPYREFCLSP